MNVEEHFAAFPVATRLTMLAALVTATARADSTKDSDEYADLLVQLGYPDSAAVGRRLHVRSALGAIA